MDLYIFHHICKLLSCFICLTNWFTVFHIDIYLQTTNFLGLPETQDSQISNNRFSLSLVPWVLQEALRNVGFRVSAYLDNLLLCTPSQNEEGTSRFLHNVPSSVGPNGFDMGCYSPGVFAKPRFGQQHSIAHPHINWQLILQLASFLITVT